MLQAAPRHIGDVEQSVDTAEIDEGAVIGDVLDRAFEDHALFEHAQRLFLQRRALAFEHAAARDHDVGPRAIEFEDLKPPALADIAIEIAHRTDVHVRTGQERRHPDIDLQVRP